MKHPKKMNNQKPWNRILNRNCCKVIMKVMQNRMMYNQKKNYLAKLNKKNRSNKSHCRRPRKRKHYRKQRKSKIRETLHSGKSNLSKLFKPISVGCYWSTNRHCQAKKQWISKEIFSQTCPKLRIILGSILTQSSTAILLLKWIQVPLRPFIKGALQIWN